MTHIKVWFILILIEHTHIMYLTYFGKNGAYCKMVYLDSRRPYTYIASWLSLHVLLDG